MTRAHCFHRLTSLALGLALLGCGQDAEPPAGARRVAIEVGPDGYDPSEIEAHVGEPLTLVVTRTSDEGCGEVLVIAAHDVERELPLDEPVEITITPARPGRLRFSCGMDMYDGAIVVTQ